jgi:alpha-glucosidase
VYTDGVAYRFLTKRKANSSSMLSKPNLILIKITRLSFLIPAICAVAIGIPAQLKNSIQALYFQIQCRPLGYLPLLVELDNDKKVVILEADVQDYPGMFIQLNQQASYGIKATFAPYPLEEALGGYNRINYMVTKRATYIAKQTAQGIFLACRCHQHKR